MTNSSFRDSISSAILIGNVFSVLVTIDFLLQMTVTFVLRPRAPAKIIGTCLIGFIYLQYGLP